jgi:hypothetical protein
MRWLRCFVLTDPSQPDNPIIFASGGMFAFQHFEVKDAYYAQNSIALLSTVWTMSSEETVDSCEAQKQIPTVCDVSERVPRPSDTTPSSSSTSE